MNNKVGQLYNMSDKSEVLDPSDLRPHTPSHGDGNGGGSDMLERVKKLEEQMSSLVTDVAVMKSNYATKEDVSSVRIEVHQAISAQTKWLAATMIGVAGISMAVAKLIF
ncbi:hemolysin XhlA [Pantoea agglomerans]|uniref:hemolysin XhlA n=1 Tax=Enterobacter agglomerans TaxID=549 RepID=UPI001F5B3864|nr:hemolysin XhlA [Pantoea agglomerans]